MLLGADSQLSRGRSSCASSTAGEVSLEVAIGAALVAIGIGVVLGTIAGYFGGLADGVISRFTDLVMAFPLLLFLVMIGSLFSYGLTRWTFHGFLSQGASSS